MCVIFHQAAGGRIRRELVADAARLNADGWGLMALTAAGSVVVERQQTVDVDAIMQRLASLSGAEVCLHLRQRTRGACCLENTHPIRINARFELMHNGTVRVPASQAERSDSWYLARTLLAPLLERQPQLLAEPSFVALVEAGLTPRNRLVLLDRQARRFIFFNRAHGTEVEGVWISGWHWIERARRASLSTLPARAADTRRAATSAARTAVPPLLVP